MTFKHVPEFSFGDLSESYTKNGRFYQTPNGDVYPSITTVLSNASDSTWLQDWKNAVGEKEAERVSRIAKSRGTNLHAICEKFLNNEPNPTKGFMSLEIANFKSIKPILSENIGYVAGMEIPLWSDTLKVAGRTDCVAQWNGIWSIVDFKTSKKVKKKEYITEYFEQTSAYARMFTERMDHKLNVNQIVIVMTVDFDKPLIFVEKAENYIESFIEKRMRVKL